MFWLQVTTLNFASDEFFFKMHDIITHKITTLTAKNEILETRNLLFTITVRFYSSHRVRLCPPRRLASFSACTVLCQSSRTKMERITLLLVQGMAEGKRRKGLEGGREGGREGG